MPYYQGDYYQGDYYTGDPFALPLLLAGGKIAGKVLPGLARKVFPGVAKRAGVALARFAGRPSTARIVGAAATGASVATALKPTTVTMPPSIAPSIIPMPPGGGGYPPPGGYTVRPTGGFKGKVQRFLPGGRTGYEYVKRRRMNVTNVKALRRAIRRATGFAKLARRVLTFTSPRAPKGKALFKRARRK